jgi:hypothetical protein
LCFDAGHTGLYFYKKYGLYATNYKHNQESSLKSFIENGVICGQTEVSGKITDVMHGCKVRCTRTSIFLFFLRLELDSSIEFLLMRSYTPTQNNMAL